VDFEETQKKIEQKIDDQKTKIDTNKIAINEVVDTEMQ